VFFAFDALADISCIAEQRSDVCYNQFESDYQLKGIAIGLT
jgi:hypothetical protein